MAQRPAPAGPGSVDHKAAPLTGVIIGTAISLLFWAMILAIVFSVR